MLVDELVAGPEDVFLPFRLYGYDPEGDAVTFTITSQPAAGLVQQLTPSNYIYRPFPDSVNTNSLTFKVASAQGQSENTIRFLTSPVTDVPMANSLSALLFTDGDKVEATGLNLAGSSFTVEVWLRPDALPVGNVFPITHGSAVLNNGLQLGWVNRRFSAGFFGPALLAPTSYADDTNWHHWAFSFDGTSKERKLYRDGVLIATDTYNAGYQGSGKLTLGSFRGSIDELRVWKTVRSGIEISGKRSRSLAGNEAGLHAYYRLNAGEGWRILDSTANKLHGYFTATSPPPQMSSAPTQS